MRQYRLRSIMALIAVIALSLWAGMHIERARSGSRTPGPPCIRSRGRSAGLAPRERRIRSRGRFTRRAPGHGLNDHRASSSAASGDPVLRSHICERSSVGPAPVGPVAPDERRPAPLAPRRSGLAPAPGDPNETRRLTVPITRGRPDHFCGPSNSRTVSWRTWSMAQAYPA